MPWIPRTGRYVMAFPIDNTYNSIKQFVWTKWHFFLEFAIEFYAMAHFRKSQLLIITMLNVAFCLGSFLYAQPSVSVKNGYKLFRRRCLDGESFHLNNTSPTFKSKIKTL